MKDTELYTIIFFENQYEKKDLNIIYLYKIFKKLFLRIYNIIFLIDLKSKKNKKNTANSLNSQLRRKTDNTLIILK